MNRNSNAVHRPFPVLVVGVLMLATLGSASPVRAFEVIPSIGMTKSTDSNAGDGKFFGGLAVRAPLLPFLKVEGGISYRQDDFPGTDIKLRQWPLTLSLWLTPIPMIYAGAGIGWYRTTLDFPANSLVKDETTQKVGVHLGGGLLVPVGSKLAVDLNGRYIFMQADDTTPLIPSTFDPDFWSLGVGLAVSF